MLDLLTKPIIGTPRIPAARFGMSLAVLTLVPGLAEFLIGMMVLGWILYLIASAVNTALHHSGSPDIISVDRAWNARQVPRLATPDDEAEVLSRATA